MLTVVSIFKIDLGFANQVISTDHVPVHHLDQEHRLLWKLYLHLKAFPEHRVELFWDVVFFVVLRPTSQFDQQVGIWLAVGIRWVQITGLEPRNIEILVVDL